jgi:hypothetical protein
MLTLPRTSCPRDYEHTLQLHCLLIAVGSTDFCIKHGAGPRCTYVEDGIECQKSADSVSGFCKTHGGGVRCCAKEEDGRACNKVSAGVNEAMGVDFVVSNNAALVFTTLDHQ